MPRFDEGADAHVPVSPDRLAVRHWGDGFAGEIVAARLQGFSPSTLDYRDVQIDVNGVVQTAGGGAGGGGAVTVADGADVAQGTTTDVAGTSTVIGLLKSIRAAITGTLTTTTSWASAQHVIVDTAPTTTITGTVTADTELPAAAGLSDNVANPTAPMVGAGTMLWDSTLNAGAGGWLRAPGTVAAGMKVQSGQLPAALVGGRLSVDASGVAVPVTGTFFQATQPVSGTVTANQGAPPWSQNLTQIAGTAIAAKALPANADGQVAIPVYVNAQQYATYDVAGRAIVSGVLTAGTAKAILSLEHALASTKTVRIRRIMVHMIQTTALSGLIDVQITRGTLASSAGTTVTPQSRRLTDPAAEVVVKTLPTITAATVADSIPGGGFAATTTLYSPPVLVYDWQEAGETKPYMLVAGALQSLVINVVSTAAHNLTLTVSVDLTEE